MNPPKSTRITLCANRCVMVLMAALLFLLPSLLRWYSTVRILSGQEQTAITAAFYCCAVLVFAALWAMDHLLRNILAESVFTPENVRLIGRVRWCCAGVSLICFPAAFVYPPLLFLSVIMGFLFLVVNVVCQVMKSAVAIREENDLTI